MADTSVSSALLFFCIKKETKKNFLTTSPMAVVRFRGLVDCYVRLLGH